MKRKINIFDFILFAYIIFHLVYGIYIFTYSLSSGVLWLAISLFEIVFAYLAIKHSRLLLIAMVVIMLLQSLASISILMLGSDNDSKDAEYALVLGYALDNNQMQETLKLRLDEAVKYAKANPKTKFVLCGGKTGKNKISEARIMEDYMYRAGVDQRRLIIEDKSQDTIENIKNSLAYIDRYKKIVVISSDYHVFRAKQICKKLDLDVHCLGTYSPMALMPNALLHEKLGLIKVDLLMN